MLEIVGAEGSGKTQVCLSLAAGTALRTKGAVLYVDTSASFSSHRLTDILGGLTGATDLLEACTVVHYSTVTVTYMLRPVQYTRTVQASPVSSSVHRTTP